jgi:uncharacterized protein YdiU (UPF0061 family)
MTLRIPFDNTWARLPARFAERRAPTPVRAPALLHVNAALADELGLDAAALAGPDGVAFLAGNLVPDGAEPLALAYAGHQFGHFVPQLGDGRALLVGEVKDRVGRRRDLQWKGSGPTAFSRRGDGRAALGTVLREFLVAEAMHALGVPTTRVLGAVTTGETVQRETLLPGAVLVRVASSHLRVGTFEFFAARDDHEALRLLVDFAVDRHFPELAALPGPARARGLLEAVSQRQASLVARWLGLGFLHGVMNTDNTALSGETLDYGPCAFLDAFDPGAVFSAIDQQGRYAYARQPRIAAWNLGRFATCLLPLLHDDEAAAIAIAEAVVGDFGAHFRDAHVAGLRAKLGLVHAEDDDEVLAATLLQHMNDARADFTNTFRALCAVAASPGASDDDDVVVRFTGQFRAGDGPGAGDVDIGGWLARWRARCAQEPTTPEARAAAMRACNPAFFPRNHLVEAALRAAHAGDLGPWRRLLDVVTHPYDDQPEHAAYAQPPRPDERVHRTFCGT